MDIMPVNDIIDTWKDLRELLDDEDWANTPPHYSSSETEPIQAVWWHARWIPFAADGFGNLTCADLAPAPGGTVGQIIDWDHECGPSQTLFPSFLEMLRAYARKLEEGPDKKNEEHEVDEDES